MKNRFQHYSPIVRLGLPIVVGQLGTIVLGFADTMMVGRHSMVELGAAAFVNTIFTIFLILALGFSYGLTPVVGSLFGQGKRNEIGGVMRNGLLANLVVSAVLLVVLTILYICLDKLGQPDELIPLMRPYLLVNMVSLPFVCWFNAFKQFFDAIGRTTLPMYIMVAGNVLNIVGNYALIYGAWGFPELGLLGAGLSTMLSRIFMALIAHMLYFHTRRFLRYSINTRKRSYTSASTFRKLNALGWPLSLQMGMESAAFSLIAIMVGWLGTTALAAHQVLLTISQLFYMVYYGLAAAVAVRVSHFNGQGDHAAMRQTAAAGFHIILSIAILFGLPVFLLRNQMGFWFTDSAEVAALVSQVIVVMMVYQFGDGLQCAYANALRGTGQVRPMMFISFFAFFVVSLPLSYLLGFTCGFGFVGIWSAFPLSLILAGSLYYYYFRRASR